MTDEHQAQGHEDHERSAAWTTAWLNKDGDHAHVAALEQLALHDTGESEAEGEFSTRTIADYPVCFETLATIYQRDGVWPADIARMTRLLHDETEFGHEYESRLIRLWELVEQAMRPALREALSHFSPRVVRRALYALAKLHEPDIGVAQLSHPEPLVRRAAASLWPRPGAAWQAAAIARLAVEPDPGVRERLVQAVSLTPSQLRSRFWSRHFPDDVARMARLHEAGLAAVLHCGQDPELSVRLAAAKWLAQFAAYMQQEMKCEPLPECCAEAVAWIETETDPSIRAALLEHIPYRRWRRLLRLRG